MSVTSDSKVTDVLEWLENNSFWNADLVEVRPSKIGGMGVFWKLGPNPDADGDTLLLRIPKSAILSPKNSFLYSLLVDHEPQEPTVDLTVGMHAIVITFIYELSLGEKSPWFPYIASFEVDLSDCPVPICLWDDRQKAALFNTEVDLLNMLDATEITNFYLECVRFAHANAEYVAKPDVFDVPSNLNVDSVQETHRNKLLQFGRYVQAVISRAFAIDKYHGLSLVPGADLFNHLSPTVTENGVEDRENVHFECDDDDDMCELCGEVGCPHEEDDDDDELEDEEDDLENDDGELENDLEDDLDEDLKQEDDEHDLDALMESDVELEASSSESESEDDNDESSQTESIPEESIPEASVITMADIEQMEMSDAETDHDDEEVSTLSLSEDEKDEKDEKHGLDNAAGLSNETTASVSGAESDLAAELSDSSKCCDIVVEKLPTKEHDYELFNTYGNDLSNAYLLQRYGFVSPNNPNTSCLLSVQMFAYLKASHQKKQLDVKLEWYEEVGFDIVNELCGGAASEEEEGEDESHDHGNECHENHDHGNGDHHNHGSECHGGDDHGDNACTSKCCNDEPPVECPETWQLSPKITNEGAPTEQTIALVRLLLLPFKVFHYKLAQVASERKLVKRVGHYLLEADVSDKEKEILVAWTKGRLARYKEDTLEQGEKYDIARELVKQEKQVLLRALEVLAD